MTTWGSVRPGGRTAQTRERVFDATLNELVQQGFDLFSVESVAAAAGVHKTTIYRRWQTKDRLVADALRNAADNALGLPAAGDIDAAVRAAGRAFLRTINSRAGIAAVRALVSGGQASPEIKEFIDDFFAARLAQIEPVVARAIRAKELPRGTSAELLYKHTAGPLYYRTLIMADVLTEADADIAATAALAAARAGAFVPSRKRR